MCHDKEKLKRFCGRQAYLVLCLCTKWLIGLWINMICFQGFDSEYPDYANLPPSRGWGKLKKWQSFSLVWHEYELFARVWPTLLRNSPRFLSPSWQILQYNKAQRRTFLRENTHLRNKAVSLFPIICASIQSKSSLYLCFMSKRVISNQQG